MLKQSCEIQIRDPYVVPVEAEQKYYLFGSTDANIWGKGTGFDVYVGSDLEQWDGPFPVFRPEESFYAEDNFWAPEVYAYQGRYYMFATFRRKANGKLGTAVLTSDSLLGPFQPHSEGPVTPYEWNCLDGTLHIDESGKPWMVFCHEWKDISDGEICAARLQEDLSALQGEPITLFRASEASWATPLPLSEKIKSLTNYVTDGPFLHRTAEGGLIMLWASFVHGSYALGVAKSVSGHVEGPWIQEVEPLFQSDGGHGMIFRTFDGRLMLTIHTPNRTPDERPIFLELAFVDGRLTLKKS
ncbi:glycoside hydrolase [Paenibacillus sp. H1-7]|uniref:glycoside hydrolase family 43 protein n=1 Tax=Paenibacillus sp. H1-7 TaxID=2282849 RepID=UPI001EF78761|nr:glycoside hydrolase family 43 protein [Paenibacillus sp. H1-7]ULL14945.1 glycoside hydrolase [Paenibacillus sp. H1-7]